MKSVIILLTIFFSMNTFASDIEIDVAPSEPLLFYSDIVDIDQFGNETLIIAPWFRTTLRVSNKGNETIEIGRVRFNIFEDGKQIRVQDERSIEGVSGGSKVTSELVYISELQHGRGKLDFFITVTYKDYSGEWKDVHSTVYNIRK